MLNTESLCMRLIQFVHVPFRLYDRDGSLRRTFIDNGEQEDPVSSDGTLLRQLLERRRTDYPVLWMDGEDVAYGIVSDGESTYIAGPCCLGSDPVTAARRMVRQHRLDRKKPYRLTSFPFADFCGMLLTVFACLTGIAMDYSEFLFHNTCDERFERELRERVHETIFARQEEAVAHNPYSQEVIEQGSIRAGDLDGLYRSFQIRYVGKIGTLAKDPLRSARNLAIVLITLACRSAIQGGLLPEVSYTMADAFTQRVEEMRTEAEAYALGRQAEVEFCKAVAALSSPGRHNALVSRFRDLVAQRIHTRVTVKELADALGVTADYLSQLVLREEGVKATEYILRAKIGDAKNQLIYSDRPYEEIALSLGFSSQSHFGQVFRKQTGLTPRQYREKYRQQESIDKI